MSVDAWSELLATWTVTTALDATSIQQVLGTYVAGPSVSVTATPGDCSPSSTSQALADAAGQVTILTDMTFPTMALLASPCP